MPACGAGVWQGREWVGGRRSCTLFVRFWRGKNTGAEEKLGVREVGFEQLGVVKVWNDAAGHYQRPEILQFAWDARSRWANEKVNKLEKRVEEKAEEEETE